jgi:hypothetical protein
MGKFRNDISCFCHNTDNSPRLLCVFENRRRDRIYGRPESHIELDGAMQVEDLTDLEVEKSFRYVY